jgi:hypothetical protein
MPVHAILLGALSDGLANAKEQARSWCAYLESGEILYFPQTPVAIPSSDLDFLLRRQQSGSRLHKNIAYKPDRDRLSGVDPKSSRPGELERLHEVMRRYSRAVSEFLSNFLTPYERRWRLDYASFRPIEEEGRKLPLRQRNDLIHTDSFPTRPTRGWRILRFFHNIHPSRTRTWVVGEPFSRVVTAFAPGKLALPRADGPVQHIAKQIAQSTGLANLVPQWKRSPYDEFMMRLHNAMKEDASFQETCAREAIEFAPGSSWMVFTETVPHSVQSGQYALEQTFLVDPAAMVTPDSAPIAILEKMTGARLT